MKCLVIRLFVKEGCQLELNLVERKPKILRLKKSKRMMKSKNHSDLDILRNTIKKIRQNLLKNLSNVKQSLNSKLRKSMKETFSNLKSKVASITKIYWCPNTPSTTLWKSREKLTSRQRASILLWAGMSSLRTRRENITANSIPKS